ncbi:MAG: hypothetical protein MMC33_003665 [Icmadophila ericetorum]|nr:hypothetical protein [Icmadophila ericetorum]
MDLSAGMHIPQLLENYQAGSAEGISLAFLTIWLLGDVTNLAGALWAGLVPTVVALAIYFTIADFVLISQCLYYNWRNGRLTDPEDEVEAGEDTPEQPLLRRASVVSQVTIPGSRRLSRASHRDSMVGLLAPIPENESPAKAVVRNVASVLLICVAGAAGWIVAFKLGVWVPTPEEGGDDGETSRAIGAEILGYTSAVCYLGARIPQIIKNHREQSCEGLSLLFFILSLIGNATYGAGIIFHSTEKQYMLTNLPWLIGSLGTMVEDTVIFIQFHIYDRKDRSGSDSALE